MINLKTKQVKKKETSQGRRSWSDDSCGERKETISRNDMKTAPNRRYKHSDLINIIITLAQEIFFFYSEAVLLLEATSSSGVEHLEE